jgi:tRNA (guanine37-N1)-methyltransferase
MTPSPPNAECRPPNATLWSVQILTLFPEMFPGPLGASLIGKALQDGLWKLDVMNIRDVATDRHKTVDDTPYGGGAGMVMRPDIVAEAVREAARRFGAPARKIYLSPRGKGLDQALVADLAACPSLLLLCGRYEGVDQRALDAEGLEEVSLGDFVLAGGEMAAMTLIEAVVRLLPGTLGNAATHDEESFTNGLLEYPHYTRPPLWEGRAVPEVLISGHHAHVHDWRLQESEKLTKERRPDLWEAYATAKKAKKTDRNG